MISHGDWTLGTYNIANEKQLSMNGVSLLCTHGKIAVKVKVITEGLQPRVVIQKPDNLYSVRVTSGLSKTAINYLPPNIVRMVVNGFLVAETPQLGEDFRDFCKHINGFTEVGFFGRLICFHYFPEVASINQFSVNGF